MPPFAISIGSAPDGPAKAAGAQVMTIRARVSGVRLTTVLNSVADRQYRDLGFDTTGEGTVIVDWTGSPDDLTVAAVLAMSAPGTTAPGLLPVSGAVDAKYFQRGGRVQINQLEAHSPATTLNVTGLLGVYPVDEPSDLSVHLVNHNLGEFDHVLKALDLGVRQARHFGCSHPAPRRRNLRRLGYRIPGRSRIQGASHRESVLHRVCRPSCRLAAAGTAVHRTGCFARSQLGHSGPACGRHPVNIYWDQLDTNASYSSSLISVDHATLTRGKTVIHASGQLQAHRISRRRQAFDDQATIDATAQVQNASLT